MVGDMIAIGNMIVVIVGSSAVECRTRHQVSLGSNPPFATVLKIGHFQFLHDAEFTQLYK